MIGRRIKRREDPRLLRGKGQYIADLRLPGMLHAAFVRSIYAHARVLDVDISVAQHMPGVVAIFIQRAETSSPTPHHSRPYGRRVRTTALALPAPCA